MAFEELPATGAGSSEAGRVVRASWGEQVRLNFNDHEERLQDVEAIAGASWEGDWDEASAYNAGDIVQHNGSSWRASDDIAVVSPVDEPGVFSPSAWVLIAQAGSDGASTSALDLAAIRRATQGLAVYSGCAVTEDNAGPGLDVDVAAGHIRLVTGAGLLVTAGEVTLDSAHASLGRIDIVWVNTSGTLGKTTGTASASPVPPDLPSDTVLLASVLRAASDNTVVNADITDKRTYTRLPQIIRKTVTESVASSVAQQNDDELKITAGASEVWAAHWAVIYDASDTAAADFDDSWAVPAGATFLKMYPGGIGPSQTSFANMAPTNLAVASTAESNWGTINTTFGLSQFLLINTMLINSTTPGTQQYLWAQGTSGLTATRVLAGSFVIAWPNF